jgi:O-acetyl-ADP-ribose deacetylase (regulator of RNase III)
MILQKTGDLFLADVDALVNPVNTVGVMGAGLAYQFKQRFFDNFAAYQAACYKGELKSGRMFVTATGRKPQWIINFPTKRHWRDQSRIEDIQSGLEDLVRVIHENSIRSVAIPPLGCGLGGLNWADVEPLILAAALQVPGTSVWVYAPGR